MADNNFNHVPKQQQGYGFDFIYDDGGTLKLAERLGARAQQQRMASQRAELQRSALKQRQDQADLAAFGKGSDIDAGDYGDLINPVYNEVLQKHRGLYKQGQFNRADFEADMRPARDEAMRLKNLTNQKKTLAAGLGEKDLIDQGGYNLGFDKAVRGSYGYQKPLDPNAIHGQVIQDADLTFGNRIADDVVKGIGRNKRSIEVPYTDPRTGREGQSTQEFDVPTVAQMKGNRITGYDVAPLVQNYLAHPQGQARAQKLIAAESANPQSKYSREKADLDSDLAKGAINQQQYDNLMTKNAFNAIAKDFGDLDSRFGATFKTGYNLDAQTEAEKEAVRSMGLKPGTTIIRNTRGGQEYTAPTRSYTMTKKEMDDLGPVSVQYAWKEGPRGTLVRADVEDNQNTGLANQNVDVTVLPTLRGVSLTDGSGKLLAKPGAVVKFDDLNAVTRNGLIYFRNQSGDLLSLPKEDFVRSGYVEYPLHAKAQVAGKQKPQIGPAPPEPEKNWETKYDKKSEEYARQKAISDAYSQWALNLDFTNKNTNKGSFFLPLERGQNNYLLQRALYKGSTDEGTLRQGLEEEARQSLLQQKFGKKTSTYGKFGRK